MSQAPLPTVSVIMPVRNEAAFIAQSLGAVLAQDYPAELTEILIADGESTDDTVARIGALPGAARVRILTNTGHIQATGLNQLIHAATGEIIVRIDGHTVIAPDYVRRSIEALQASGADEVGGGINPTGLTRVGRAIAAACRSAFAVPGAFHAAKTPQWTDTVYMGVWPRAVLLRLGGFAADLPANEDYELNYRLRKDGGRIWFDPAIRSTYYGRQTFGALARQYFRYGAAKTAMLRRYPQSLRWRQLVAPTFVGACLVLAIGAVWLVPARLGLLALMLLYGGAASLAARRTIRANEPFGLVVAAFATMHYSWGAGFWWGWLRGWRSLPVPQASVARTPQQESRIGS
jgi:succinoglycan biosynthesis protein ExoA